ncbi:hypothetical protein MPER_08018, partial [Moniliophthora perniciosa FA553]
APAVGKEILGRRHVLPSVPSMIEMIQIEGTFEDGRWKYSIRLSHGETIKINASRHRIKLKVTNNG